MSSIDCLCSNFDFWFQMIGVFGCNLDYLLDVIHMLKSESRNVDAALVQENEILIFNLHGTAPKQITSISAEEHLEDKFSRIPANVCPFTMRNNKTSHFRKWTITPKLTGLFHTCYRKIWQISLI